MRSAPCFALLAALAAACAGSDDAPTLTRIRAEPAGAQCAAGGRAVQSGPDRDGDGFLGDAEVASVDYLCAAAPISALFRSDELPSGAGCASGGVALLVGSDDDGDGFLGDAEIEQRSTVCHDGDARAVMREDTEAPGIDCHLGGTTVAAGPDRDGDGALATLEIEGRVHVCTLAAVNVLTRADREPVGPRCVDGGTAIHAGLDDDLDGMLDDGEIDATHRLCDVVEIASGDVIIDGTTTAEQLARYARLRVILGALTIRDVATVDLPVLELVGGGLLVGGTTAHVAAPRLGTVAGSLIIRDTPTSVDLASLTRVAGGLSVGVTGFDLSLPALVSVGDGVSVALRRLHAPKLAEISGRLLVGGAPELVSMAALTRVGGTLELMGRSASTDLPRLAESGDLWITYNATGDIRLPALHTVRGSVLLNAPDVTGLALPLLRTIQGDVTIVAPEDDEGGDDEDGGDGDSESEDLHIARLDLSSLETAAHVRLQAPTLTRVDLGRLRTLASLRLFELPAVTRLDLATLTTVDVLSVDRVGITSLDLPALSTVKIIAVVGNPALAMLAFDSVLSLGTLELDNNPRLATILARALFRADTIRVWSSPQLASVVTRLEEVGVLGLTATALTDLQSFRSLRRAGALVLGSNASLTSTAGLASLAGLGDLVLENNPALTTIAAQPNLTALDGGVAVNGNARLTSLAGFGRVTRIGRSVTIARNAALRNVSGMERLVLIQRDLVINDNAVLDSLAGFSALRAVGGALTISANPRLPAAEQTNLRTRIGR